MNVKFQFYCLQCEQVVQGDTMSNIFKTGFYRYNIKMGHCKECTNNQLKYCEDSQIVEKSF